MAHSSNDRSIGSPDQPTVFDAPASGAGSDTLAPGKHLGPYRIERLLGEGGMGAVYLAEQLEPVQRRVALKLIRDQLRGGLAEAYFMVERQALARMDHPAIAKVYDAGTTPEGFPYFAMEWIDGPTLAAFCATHPLALRDKLTLFMGICLGVHHAHQKGMIHRDLKPSNVLIAEVDGKPFPKIIDFGVAIGATHGAAGAAGAGTPLMQRAGTRGYMSPEQIHGENREIDIRSDVYALGVILLELLAPPEVIDRAASGGWNNRDLHSALCASLGQPVSPSVEIIRQMSAIPAELRWVLTKSIEPDRARRYDSAQALASDLERFLEHRPVSAVPATRNYRMRTFVSRHRRAIVAMALAGAALITGSAAAVYGMVHARAAAERATIEASKSKEIARFLGDVLSGVDPNQARDLDKTLLHLVLDRAAERAAKELATQPEVLAEIEGTIGQTYTGLSEPARALQHTQHAFELSRDHAGPEAIQSLRLERQLARDLLYSGKVKEAHAIIERNTATLIRIDGPDDKDALHSALQLARTERELGDYAGAEKHLQQLVPTTRRVFGADDKVTLQALGDQAIVLGDLGRFTEAEPVYQELLTRETKLMGAEDPETLDTLNGFAILYLESQRFAEGAKLLQQALPICEKIFGPDHVMTLNIVSNLAGALRQQATPEKIAESGPYYKRALDGVLKKYGEKHPNAIMATHNYANYLLDVGDVAQAVATQQHALALATELLGADHEVTGEIEYGLGKALLKAERYAQSESALLAGVAVKQKIIGAEHWRMDEYMVPLVELYKAWGKPDQAAAWQAKRAALQPKPASSS